MSNRSRYKWLAPLEPYAKESDTAQCQASWHPARLFDRSTAPDMSAIAQKTIINMNEREQIEELHQRYLSLKENTLWQQRDGEECKAYHNWYDSAYVYFKSFGYLQDDPDFQTFVNAEKEGNCFVLAHIYDSISPSYKVLMVKTENTCEADKTEIDDLDCDIWALIHPQIAEVSKKRMSDGYYADAVEAACKMVNSIVREIVLEQTGDELDGAGLMRKAFSPTNPIIRIADVDHKSGHDTQQGYMDIFAGMMTGIRNPKAHDNENISKEDALRKLILASLLLFKIDSRI